MEDPSIDLSIACALLSSLTDMPLPLNMCFAAEIGLSGELRGVARVEQRIMEAEKLGFEKICIAKHNMRALKQAKFNIELLPASKLEEIYKQLFV